MSEESTAFEAGKASAVAEQAAEEAGEAEERAERAEERAEHAEEAAVSAQVSQWEHEERVGDMIATAMGALRTEMDERFSGLHTAVEETAAETAAEVAAPESSESDKGDGKDEVTSHSESAGDAESDDGGGPSYGSKTWFGPKKKRG